MSESRKIIAKFNALNKKKQKEIGEVRCIHRHNIFEHPLCFKQLVNPHLGERVGFFDIETTNLVASFGYILSYCIKKQGEDKIIEGLISPKDIRNGTFDKNLVDKMCEDIRQFDRLIGFYSTKFDIPFCRTRALRHGSDFPVFKEIMHTDVYYMARHRLKLHSNRLQSCCDFFNIPSKGHRLTPDVWQRANAGDQKALNYIMEHNREDVVSTELLYNKLMDFTPKKDRSIYNAILSIVW